MVIRVDDIVIDRRLQLIRRGDAEHQFTKRGPSSAYRKGTSIAFEAISFIILKGWANKHDLFEHVYGQCYNGGPDDGIHVFDIHLLHWKKYWHTLGLRLMREKRGGIMHFALRKADV